MDGIKCLLWGPPFYSYISVGTFQGQKKKLSWSKIKFYDFFPIQGCPKIGWGLELGSSG